MVTINYSMFLLIFTIISLSFDQFNCNGGLVDLNIGNERNTKIVKCDFVDVFQFLTVNFVEVKNVINKNTCDLKPVLNKIDYFEKEYKNLDNKLDKLLDIVNNIDKKVHQCCGSGSHHICKEAKEIIEAFTKQLKKVNDRDIKKLVEFITRYVTALACSQRFPHQEYCGAWKWLFEYICKQSVFCGGCSEKQRLIDAINQKAKCPEFSCRS
ncbi:uncharacterized protein LOC128963991 [Oppia nitens]|uniref:uncharacterized protein LOC128963991 n=1 Tax=Oppia nitens TaxID=1686743 RepID=UPI0023DA74AA|nr:uncharacterized protein LOC128963991 [Oppia nitens]